MKKFNIEVEMPERWVNDFMSMLEYMQNCGAVGRSRYVILYADGDGDFRPKFKANIDYKTVEPKCCMELKKAEHENGNWIYDAG